MYFLAPLLLRGFRQKFVLLCPVGHLRNCQYYSEFIILSDGHISLKGPIPTSQQYITVCIGTTIHRILNHCFSLLTYAWLNHNFKTYLWSQLYMTTALKTTRNVFVFRKWRLGYQNGISSLTTRSMAMYEYLKVGCFGQRTG